MALRVVLAEDNFLLREGTRRLLEDAGDVHVLDSVGTADDLLASVGRHQPDVAITDIRMPPEHRMEGIDAALRIRRDCPRVGVVVLSQHSDEGYAFALFQNGSEGLAYLLKERVGDTDELLRALYEVAAGRSVVDSQVIAALVGRRARQRRSPLADLTPRELDVLRHMATGLTNSAIAERLVLSESAIEKHVAAIFAKLLPMSDAQAGTHRRVAAVLAFLRAET